ncbi:VLRF1 family aeRF1-type release factor [Nonomuraea typhae]|uniref:VLRF1 family aeRF1-type release factor n=1 Tax=Nonomuraea typhae TaxID=2603600 RepID=A0ABW7ZC63_9ACTN
MFDQTFLRELVAMKDDIGVVSLYATADPREEASTRPARAIRLRNDLATIRDQVGSWQERDRREAVLSRLQHLEPDILELLDAAESGIGRALFASVGDKDVRKVSLQVPITDCAVLEPTAYIRPLITAMATSAPAGLVLVSRDGLRLIDVRYGVAEDVDQEPFEIDTEDWRPMVGPGPGGTAQPVATQTDRFHRRVEDHLRRSLQRSAPEITRRAKENGWVDVLLIGDIELTETLATALHPLDTIQVDKIVDALAPAEAARKVSAELAATRIRRDTALVTKAVDAAKCGGRGALGLNQTLALLNEGRVDHLLLDESATWTGFKGLDGFLYDQQPVSVPADEVPDLGERMIETALNSGVTLTTLTMTAAAPLLRYDGVAALLRW